MNTTPLNAPDTQSESPIHSEKCQIAAMLNELDEAIDELAKRVSGITLAMPLVSRRTAMADDSESKEPKVLESEMEAWLRSVRVSLTARAADVRQLISDVRL